MGRYELHEVLGTGAFATVYRATDPRLDAPVAIKILADNWSQDLDIRRRFRSEAVLLRRVQSEATVPGIVQVFDIDESEDGRPFIVISYADLGTLGDRSRGQVWSSADVAPVIDSVAHTVGALHRAGVVHRDLKPSNLLLRTDHGASGAGALVKDGERLLVGDLGMAKDSLAATTALSFAGGSIRYMAPEQRDVSASVSPSADVHAASVLVAELLTGPAALPLPGMELEGKLPSSLDPDLWAVLNRGVSTNPNRRQTSMSEWRSELLAAFDKGSTPAPKRRLRRLAVGSALALAAAGAAAGAVFVVGSDDAGLEITGPAVLVVGEASTYQVVDGESALWTDWTGAQVSSTEFEIVASLPGQLTFSAARDSEQGDVSVEVVESTLGPTINGPETLRLGQEAVFTATLPTSAASSYWLDPNGERHDTPDFRFVPTDTGNAILSLVAVDPEGVERGSRQIVAVEP